MTTLSQLTLDDNNIAFHPMMGNSYQLNDLGKEIITLLREGKSKDEVMEHLLKDYDVPYNSLFIDVSDFFAKLRVYGLIL